MIVTADVARTIPSDEPRIGVGSAGDSNPRPSTLGKGQITRELEQRGPIVEQVGQQPLGDRRGIGIRGE